MNENSPNDSSHVVTSTRAAQGSRSRFEWRVVHISPGMTHAEAQSLLTEQAEYGHWELARSVKYIGGARKVWLKRRTMRVHRTQNLPQR